MDRENIALAPACGVTGLMQPFVRDRADLETVRAALDAAGGREIRLFAKIENREGVENLGTLIPACDEIVIARGDLGNAMPLWELPAAQKRIAAQCLAAGRPFMVVTQMLASMEQNPVPTRAEVSDIFNAVLDGAASVMVTGETAAGKWPVETIRYLTETVRQAEAYKKEGNTQ
jgi:pyruvate kinase